MHKESMAEEAMSMVIKLIRRKWRSSGELGKEEVVGWALEGDAWNIATYKQVPDL